MSLFPDLFILVLRQIQSLEQLRYFQLGSLFIHTL